MALFVFVIDGSETAVFVVVAGVGSDCLSGPELLELTPSLEHEVAADRTEVSRTMPILFFIAG